MENKPSENVNAEAVLKIFEEIKSVLNNHSESIKELDRRVRIIHEELNKIKEDGK